MPDETPTVVPFHYIKSNLFRVVHTDGALGNVTPGGLIFVGFYSERGPIPQVMVHEVTEAGQVGPERQDERVSKKGIVREVEVGAMMSAETATSFIAWLQEKIDLIHKLRKTAELEKPKNAPCIDDIDVTTASHRPVIGLPVYLLLVAITNTLSGNGHGEGAEPAPSDATVRTAIDLVAEVPFRLLGEPDISPFYGEIHISWTRGAKQIVVMCFPNRAPLLHHYLRVANGPSVHDIEEASSDGLANWLRWLRE